MARALTALVLASLALAGCATETADDEASEEAIIGGTDASDPSLDAVGTIGRVYTGGLFDAFCTGTLIAPDKVVTAKHCAQDSTGEAPYVNDQAIGFAIGANADKPKRVVTAKSVTLASVNEGGFIGFGQDLAIYTLAETVSGVTPAKLATKTLGPEQLGRRFIAVGFGAQDYQGKTRGTRRAGAVTVRAVAGSPMQAIFRTEQEFMQHLVATEGAAWVGDNQVDLKAFYRFTLLPGREVHVGLGKGDVQPCDGDSGGPLLERRGKELTVHAVVSGSKKGRDGRCSVLGETYASVKL